MRSLSMSGGEEDASLYGEDIIETYQNLHFFNINKIVNLEYKALVSIRETLEESFEEITNGKNK